MTSKPLPKVFIVGGGFAGLAAAEECGSWHADDESPGGWS
jgi:monoamine oxidase